MKQEESRDLLLSIFGVALIILVITGITYAVFRYTVYGEKVNVITTGSIKMSYIESTTNVISINDAIPIADYIGKKQEDYFDFTLSSSITGMMRINYDIVAKHIPSENDLNPNQVKIYLEKKEGSSYQQVLAPTNFNEDTINGMMLYRGIFNNTTNDTMEFVDNYRLRMWIDDKEQLTDRVKSFKVKINVHAET